jgi:hypothetical protein
MKEILSKLVLKTKAANYHKIGLSNKDKILIEVTHCQEI